jgi:hypothetical protein
LSFEYGEEKRNSARDRTRLARKKCGGGSDVKSVRSEHSNKQDSNEERRRNMKRRRSEAVIFSEDWQRVVLD